MHYQPLAIADVVLMTPDVFGDARGFFMETFRQADFEKYCGKYQFVQDNHSRSKKGILRGLHYQLTQPQGKLVRVVQGEIFDVAVDMRQNSPTFGQWVGEYLSEKNRKLLWVPPGFAHGFLVLSEQAEFVYKCTDYYVPSDEHVLIWHDKTVDIAWPTKDLTVQLSEKDQQGLDFVSVAKFV